MKGDCFPMAVLVANTTQHRLAVVCHGIPTLQGGPHVGERYWHAWVEVPMPLGGWRVLDRSNGLDIDMPRDFYYDLGRIDPEEVWRFMPAEVVSMMLRFDHYGPWVDGWQDMIPEDYLTPPGEA